MRELALLKGLRVGEDWGQVSRVLSTRQGGDLGSHPAKVSVSPSHPIVLTTSGSGGAAWRELPGPQETPTSSSSRPRVQHHSTARAWGCLEGRWEGPNEGDQSPPPPRRPHSAEPELPTTIENRGGDGVSQK